MLEDVGLSRALWGWDVCELPLALYSQNGAASTYAPQSSLDGGITWYFNWLFWAMVDKEKLSWCAGSSFPFIPMIWKASSFLTSRKSKDGIIVVNVSFKNINLSFWKTVWLLQCIHRPALHLAGEQMQSSYRSGIKKDKSGDNGKLCVPQDDQNTVMLHIVPDWQSFSVSSPLSVCCFVHGFLLYTVTPNTFMIIGGKLAFFWSCYSSFSTTTSQGPC